MAAMTTTILNTGVILLTFAHCPAWAQQFLKAAVAQELDDTQAHNFLGGTYAALRWYSGPSVKQAWLSLPRWAK